MLRALLRLAFVLWMVSILVFLLPLAMPGDPAAIALVERQQAASAENIQALRRDWGLEQSLPAQYVRFLAGFVSGDWGVSLRTGRPVIDEMAPRLPWSAAVGIGGLLMAAFLCLPLGYAAACRPGGAVDAATRLGATAAQSLPAFVLALAWLLSGHWRLVDVYTGGPAQRLLLPVLLVGLYVLAPLTRLVRKAFVDAEGQPYMRTARAMGHTRRSALRRHALRPALLTLLAALTPQAAWVVGGTAVVEIAFAVPGLSQLVVESVASRDHAVLRAYIMAVALLMVAAQAAAIVLQRALDPRPLPCDA
jgi:peptide/nickel transport system permease protein